MSLVCYGKVKGGVVLLPKDIHLTDGLVVEIRVDLPKGEVLASPSEEAFKQRLLESGLLREIKRPSPFPSEEDRTPIQVRGESLSKAIIRERR